MLRLAAFSGLGALAALSSSSSSVPVSPPSLSSSAPSAPTAPPLEPILFLSPSDITDTYGLQYPVPMQASLVPVLPGNGSAAPPFLATVIEGGLLDPSPLQPERGYEVFYVADCTSPECNGTAVYAVTTTDFVSFSPAVRVGRLPQLTTGKCAKTPCTCLAKSMARSESGRRHALLTICPDAGIRPLVCDGPVSTDCFARGGGERGGGQRGGGDSWRGGVDGGVPPVDVDTKPAFYDHDDQSVFAVGETFVNFQITFQNQDRPLRYCDNVGLERCAQGFRRVVTTRISADGRNWSNDAACPHERWYPGGDYNPFDPQFRECPQWWLPGMVTPDARDPPELEFYKLYPFRVGSTTRTAAAALLYAPAPQASLGPNYGMQKATSDGPRNNSGACGTGEALTHCHGPHMGVELWVGPPAVTSVAVQPLNQTWSRPFRLFANNRRSLVAPRGPSCPGCGPGELFDRGPITFGGHLVWLTTLRDPPGGVFFLGVPEHRVVGMYAPANAEFTTAEVLTLSPGGGVWINADARWTPTQPGAADGADFAGCDEGCAAYVMVALLDAKTGAEVPGFAKEGCVLMNVNGTRLPLTWHGAHPPAGEYRLRVYYRDAIVYAAGAL